MSSPSGIPLIGVPKTIDNDIVGTLNCFGFDTRLTSPLMRSTGFIRQQRITGSWWSGDGAPIGLDRPARGVAGGADVILIPEIPFDLTIVANRIREREAWGARFSIVVVAEGAIPSGGAASLIATGGAAGVERLGGIGQRVAADLQKLTSKEARYVVLGHLQRGGTPTSYDRVLATRFGTRAVECLVNGETGRMVACSRPRSYDSAGSRRQAETRAAGLGPPHGARDRHRLRRHVRPLAASAPAAPCLFSSGPRRRT